MSTGQIVFLFLTLFCVFFSLYCAVNPRSVVRSRVRWQVQGDVEPSDAAVAGTRIIGIILTPIFIVMTLLVIFNP